MPHLKAVVGDCDGPLGQVPGAMGQAKKERLHLRKQAHSLPTPASPVCPAQNLAPLTARDLRPAQGYGVKKGEAGTFYIHLFWVTSIQESLVNKFQLKSKLTTKYNRGMDPGIWDELGRGGGTLQKTSLGQLAIFAHVLQIK